MERPNVQYRLIDKWNGVDRDYILNEGSDGMVVEITHVAFMSNNSKLTRIAEGAVSTIDGCQFIIEAIFAHPESGCAWAYAREYMGTQYVEINIDVYKYYSGDGSMPDGDGVLPLNYVRDSTELSGGHLW